MTNFEKYKDDEALDNVDFGLVNGKPRKCYYIECGDCDFFLGGNGPCNKRRMEWLKKEYEEPKINLPNNLPIDAKIEVSDDGKKWTKRHFAGFDGENAVKAWCNGTTSWTSFVEETSWKYARLPIEDN